MTPPEAVLASLVYAAVTRLFLYSGPRTVLNVYLLAFEDTVIGISAKC